MACLELSVSVWQRLTSLASGLRGLDLSRICYRFATVRICYRLSQGSVPMAAGILKGTGSSIRTLDRLADGTGSRLLISFAPRRAKHSG